MGLGAHTLTNFLTVRGLKTTGKKAELVARAFSAVELNLPIIQSTEQQQVLLKDEYGKKLARYDIPDPRDVDNAERSDNVTKWPNIYIQSLLYFAPLTRWRREPRNSVLSYRNPSR